MKKIYSTPALRYVDMEAEQMIASSPLGEGTQQTLGDDETDAQWTDKKNLWGDEGIWK